MVYPFDDVLYVIGNGFDFHHGVKCSYNSFCHWLRRHHIELFYRLERLCRVEFFVV